MRYRVQTLPTRTFEEAPVTLGAWMAQRTRWMKGWMQTYIVHNHRPLLFLRDAGWRNFLAFQFYVGGMVLSAPLHLVFLIALLVRLILSGQTGMGVTDGQSYTYLFLLIAGYIGTAAHSITGVRRLNRRGLMRFQVFLPFYWALIGVAAFRAAFELLYRPYFWAKTQHGVTRQDRNTPQ